MSICIALVVPDGIALAADSQTTWSKTIKTVKEKNTGKEVDLEKPIDVPISWSKMTRKVFGMRMAGNNYAACIAGTALLNSKTLYSVFRSLETGYEGKGVFEDVVSYLRDGIKKELVKELGTKNLNSADRIVNVDFIIAGYDSNDISEPRLANCSVFSGEPIGPDGNKIKDGHYIKWINNGSNKFGACWIGRSEFISHLINHKNKDLPQIQGQYALFSLSDAKEYARFLVEYTCDFQRFAVMVPDCGRPIIISELTPDGYKEEII